MKRFLLLAILAAACHGQSSEEETQTVVSVRVARAEVGTIAQPIEMLGTITSRQEANISSKISGQITLMPLLKNRVVRRGDVLVQVEVRDVAAQRAEAAAALTTARDAIAPAETALETARHTYQRRQELYERGGISKKDLEGAQLDVANASGALEISKSRVMEAMDHLSSLDAQLGYASIRAPFDGVVIDQFAYQGDFATAGNKLLTIDDASVVIVKAPLADENAVRVRAGDAATVMPDDLPGVALQSHVSLVGRSADSQSRAVEIWVTLPNQDGRLRPNATAKVTIASNATANAVIVPTAAVMLDATDAGGGTVMVVDAQSIAHEVRVSIGSHDKDRTQITSGLHGGETVVIEGNYGLPDKAKVAVAR